MCVRARCTSPTEARGRAGTPCPASLAQMAAEELPGGGDGSFLNFRSFMRMSLSFSAN